MKLNGYQIVNEAIDLSSIQLYHYTFPRDNYTSQDIVKSILRDKMIKPGSEIEGTENTYANRVKIHRREEGGIYLTPHNLNIDKVDRFKVPLARLDPSKIKVHIGMKQYRVQDLASLLSKYSDKKAQYVFDHTKERRFRRLIQIVYFGQIRVSVGDLERNM